MSLIARLLCAFLVTLLVAGCAKDGDKSEGSGALPDSSAGSQSKPLDPELEVAAAVQRIVDNINGARSARRDWYPDEGQLLVERIGRLNKKIHALKSHGLQRGDPAGVQAEVAHTSARVASLASEMEACLVRGGAEAHRAAAEIDADLWLLREIANKLNQSPEAVPRNAYAFVDPATRTQLLEELRNAHHEANKRAVVLPPGTLDRVRAEFDAETSRVSELGDAPGVDLVARFFHAAERGAAEPPDGDWLRDLRSQRDTIARTREVELLKLAVARDVGDARSLARLRMLDPAGTPSSLAYRSLGVRRAVGALVTPSSAAKMLAGRYSDPVFAAVAEGVLQTVWREQLPKDSKPISGSTDGFYEWVAHQLSVEELAEVLSCVEEARQATARLAVRIHPALQSSPIDQQAADREYAALQRECAARLERPLAPSSVFAADSLPFKVNPGLRAQDFPAEYRENVWLALARLVARPDSEPAARMARDDFAVVGFVDYVGVLENDAAFVHRPRVLGEEFDAWSVRKPNAALVGNVRMRARSLLLGLSAIDDPREKDLSARVRAVISSFSDVPPTIEEAFSNLAQRSPPNFSRLRPPHLRKSVEDVTDVSSTQSPLAVSPFADAEIVRSQAEFRKSSETLSKELTREVFKRMGSPEQIRERERVKERMRERRIVK